MIHPRTDVATKAGILLVVPPFQSTLTPAMGVSQLKANLAEHSLDSEILYLNLRFADLIGVTEYEHIVSRASTLFGDFIFSRTLFECEDSELERYVRDLFAGTDISEWLSSMSPNSSLKEILQRLIQAASDWVDSSAEMILDRDPWMVGFTSTFQQNCSSLALMRELKKRRPEIITVMGGNNCEGEMGEELFDRFPEIDYMGRGECDHSFVELVRSLRNGNDGCTTPGILSRSDNGITVSSEPLKSSELEALPYPDFEDYFAQLPLTNFGDQVRPALVMETSRGCWWGAKHHCKFCGLNGDGMDFRSKSGARVIGEMETLVEKYGVSRIALVDNILDMKYFKTLLPRLVEKPVADLFYETKANLTKEQVRMLADSKISWIQPGIESLSDSTLKLMDKGVTELQNVQLLKWCTEDGILVEWNFLFGFPGEREDELDQLVSHAESLHHLAPPNGVNVLHLDRFSPYFNAPEQYGLDPIYPGKPYQYVYPFADDSLRRLAYFFDSDYFLAKKEGDGFKTLKTLVVRWKKMHAGSHLLAIARKKSLMIVDTRSCARRFLQRLTGVRRRVYEYCYKARGLAGIVKAAAPEVSREEVEAALDSFVHDKLMLKVNGQYLSLATAPEGNYKRYTTNRPGGAFRLRSVQRYAQRLVRLRGAGAMVSFAGRAASKISKAAIAKVRSKTLFLFVQICSQPQAVRSPR